jgi:hypothetical protein
LPQEPVRAITSPPLVTFLRDGIAEAWLYVTTGTLVASIPPAVLAPRGRVHRSRSATPEGDAAKAKMPSGRSNMP